MAARYWRLAAVRPWGLAGLEISEVALYGTSGRIDATATITSRIPPVSGDLAALKDGSAAEAVKWSAAQVAAPGWALVWTFPADVDVAILAVGAGASQSGYPCDLRLESSADGQAWTVVGEVGGLLYPGAFTLGSIDGLRQRLLSLDFNGGAIVDALGHGVTVYGGAHIASASPLIDGTPYLSLAGGNDYLQVSNAPDLHLKNDYEIGFDLFVPAGDAGGAVWHQGFYNADTLTWTAPGISIRLLDGRLRFYFYATTNVNEQYLDVPYTANQAQQWRMVRSGGNGAVWRDGVQVSSRSGLGTLPAPTRPLQIGRWEFSHGTPTMTARLDNLYAGSASQIANAGALRVSPVGAGAVEIPTASDVPEFSLPAPTTVALARDVQHGGAGRIWGTTKTKATINVPTKARVVLLHQRSKVVVRETWSDPVSGVFSFPGIDTRQEFLTLAEDAAGNFRPVAANRLVPEVQP